MADYTMNGFAFWYNNGRSRHYTGFYGRPAGLSHAAIKGLYPSVRSGEQVDAPSFFD